MLTRTFIAEATLTDAESKGLRRLVAQVQADAYAEDSAGFDTVLADSRRWIPKRLWSLTVAFGERLGAAGVLRFRGLPIPACLPPTPHSPDAGLRARSGAEALLLGLATLVGSVISSSERREGLRVHNVYPIPEDADTQKSSNAVRLGMHTEATFAPDCPEALAILYLRNGGDRAAATAFCDLHQVWDGLSAAEQASLSRSAFFTAGRDRNGNEVSRDTVAVAYPFGDVSASKKGRRFQYIPALRGATADDEEALRRFSAGIEATTAEITMAPGDLIFIDNTHVVHGRACFVPRFDGTDRWLQRCLLRQRDADPAAALASVLTLNQS